MVLYDVSENNWKRSMDIWHVNKAVSNYEGLSVFKAEQTVGSSWMCSTLMILAQDLAASSIHLFEVCGVGGPLHFRICPE